MARSVKNRPNGHGARAALLVPDLRRLIFHTAVTVVAVLDPLALWLATSSLPTIAGRLVDGDAARGVARLLLLAVAAKPSAAGDRLQQQLLAAMMMMVVMEVMMVPIENDER